MTLKVTPFEPKAHIQTPEDVMFYLQAALEGGDATHVMRALGDVFTSPAWQARA